MSLNNEDFDLNMNAIEALLALDDVDSVGKNYFIIRFTLHTYSLLFNIVFVYFLQYGVQIKSNQFRTDNFRI